jgi:hypothetical protein
MSIRGGALRGGLLLLASFACAHARHVDAAPGDASGAAASGALDPDALFRKNPTDDGQASCRGSACYAPIVRAGR